MLHFILLSATAALHKPAEREILRQKKVRVRSVCNAFPAQKQPPGAVIRCCLKKKESLLSILKTRKDLKMKNTKKLAALLLAAVMLCMLFTGCGSSSTDTGSGSDAAT
ncbi:MAG: hypothetical protein LUF77_06000, partial [Oscillospiraceae bacterium]|nr:hypothetical protein [Oscillospiraceae bacterium]